MPRAWLRMPAAYDLASGDSPYDDSASANEFRDLVDRVQALVGVHARAVDAVDRLGHERRVQAVLLGDRLERELEGDRVVRRLERVGVLEVDLVLAGRDLVVGRLDADPELLQGVDHVVPDGDRKVGLKSK